MSNPDVSFNLGPNDSPVKVTLGRQSGLSGGVANNQDSSLQVPPFLFTISNFEAIQSH